MSHKDKMNPMNMTSSDQWQITSLNPVYMSLFCPLVVCMRMTHLQNRDTEPRVRCCSAQITLAGRSTCRQGHKLGCEEKRQWGFKHFSMLSAMQANTQTYGHVLHESSQGVRRTDSCVAQMWRKKNHSVLIIFYFILLFIYIDWLSHQGQGLEGMWKSINRNWIVL